MRCPYCESNRTRVVDTTRDSQGIRRRRLCKDCNERYSTYERAILDTPLVIKQDKSRELFDIVKLKRGIEVACAKRPVAAADIERLAGEIEVDLQRMGKLEVSSRVIGDKVIAGLKLMDHIAYIRYAIVYLKLDDLDSLRAEIDRLLESEN